MTDPTNTPDALVTVPSTVSDADAMRAGKAILDAHGQWEIENNRREGQNPWQADHIRLLGRAALSTVAALAPARRVEGPLSDAEVANAVGRLAQTLNGEHHSVVWDAPDGITAWAKVVRSDDIATVLAALHEAGEPGQPVTDWGVIYVQMPVDRFGNGPAEPNETDRVEHQVWDAATNETVCTARDEATAQRILSALDGGLRCDGGVEMSHLKPENEADLAIASDLGRKAGNDVATAMFRTMALTSSPYQQEVTALAGAVAAIGFAGNILRLGSAPTATDQDVVEALVEMMGASKPVTDGGA